MRKFNFLVVIACLILSCSSPEKEAEAVMKQFTASLNDIGDVTNISALDLSRKLKTCRENVEELIEKKRNEFTKSEEKERFDNVISINDNEIYLALRKELTNESLKSLENVKSKKWINSESLSSSSIFTLNESCISFLNLKNKFNYEIKNGDIIFENDGETNPLYFTMEGDELIITNGQEQVSKFREVQFEELIQAKWLQTHNSKCGITFKKDGKGIDFMYDMISNLTYIIKDKKITATIFSRSKYVANDIRHYKYLSNNDMLKFTDYGASGAEYFRAKEKGPDCLTFLFDGKIKVESKTQTIISTSDSDNNLDSILDSYEKFVNEYIKLLKKAQNGDTSVITKYTECLEKAESLQSKLEGVKADLTMKQVNRLNKINSKLAKAALSAL